jgi:hypothetical protein
VEMTFPASDPVASESPVGRTGTSARRAEGEGEARP